MEQELKELLQYILKQKSSREEDIQNATHAMENLQNREKSAIEKFEQGFEDDINEGLYNMTSEQIRKELESGKQSISARFQQERKELEEKIEGLAQLNEQTSEAEYRNIMMALRKYRDEQMVSRYNAQKEIQVQSQKLSEEINSINAQNDTLRKEMTTLEQQKQQEIEEFNNAQKDIKEQEEFWTVKIHHSKTLSADEKSKLREFLAKKQQFESKESSIPEKYEQQIKAHGIQIETNNNRIQDLNNEINQLNTSIEMFDKQIENVNQFFGKIVVREKSPKEIYEILFEQEISLDEVEQPEVYAEPVVEEEPEIQVEPMIEEEPEVQEVPIVEEEPEVQEVPVVEEELEVQIEPAIEEEPEVEQVLEEEIEPVEQVEPQLTAAHVVIMPEKKVEPKIPTPVITKMPQINIPTPVQKKEEPQPKKEESKKFCYEFSKKGIKYNGKVVNAEELLVWYDNFYEDIDNVVEFALQGAKKTDKFLACADKLIYSTILYEDAIRDSDGKIQLTDKAIERLREYYRVWANPKSEKETNMKIRYNLKGLFGIFGSALETEFSEDELLDIKENAFELRNRKDVSVTTGIFTMLEFRVRDMLEKRKVTPKLNAPEGKYVSTNKESFKDRLKVGLQDLNKSIKSKDTKTHKFEKNNKEEER